MAIVTSNNSVYASLSKSTHPRVCSGCGVEFGEDVDMFEPVASDPAKQAARKLMDNPPDELLCPGCFMDHLKSLDKKVLAAVIMGMAKKIEEIEHNQAMPKAWPSDQPYQPYTTSPAITPQTVGIPGKTYTHPPGSPPPVWCMDKPSNSGTIL